MNLAPSASGAKVWPGDEGGSFLVLLQAPFGTKGDADTTGLAPGLKYIDSVWLGRIL